MTKTPTPINVPLVSGAFSHEQETRALLSAWLLQGHQLSMGPLCETFERRFSAWQGRQFSVLFNSGSSANLALIQALLNHEDLEPGATVGVSAVTWATNVMPLLQLGLRPIPIDVWPQCLNVHAEELEAAIRYQHLDALFITNALGLTGDLEDIADLCRKRKVMLLEDNCESLGTILASGTKAGNFGYASTFSFYVAHQLSTIEGGMVCTDCQALADALRCVRAHGWDRNLSETARRTKRALHRIDPFQAGFTFYAPAFNLRPTEITGLLGCEQLKHLDADLAERDINFSALQKVARDNPDLLHVFPPLTSRLSSFAYPVLCRTLELRTTYLAQFAAEGVETRPLIAGDITRQPFWKRAGLGEWDLPGASFLNDCAFYCGNYPGIDIEPIRRALCRKTI